MKVNIGEYTHEDSERLIEIEIHDYDVWNLDHTLAMIILPCLKKLKEIKHGAPNVEDQDVPAEIRKDQGIQETVPDPSATDDNFFERWDYVLDKMILAMEFIVEGKHMDFSDDIEEHEKTLKQVKEGTYLFGKYFNSLWD